MVIDTEFLDELLRKAAESERLRYAYDMRTSAADTSQRLLNALQSGTKMPVHRHRASAESVVIVKGAITYIIYDDNANEIERFVLDASIGNHMAQIPAGAWHTVVCDEPCVIFEVKDGGYVPMEAEDIMNN